MTITQKWRGRRVTHEEAAESAQRLVNSHFHNPDSARCSIPANPDDDDLIVTDYILEQKESKEVAFPKAKRWLVTGGPFGVNDEVVGGSDYDAAIAQIAALTAQVEELNEQREDIASLGSEWKHRAEKAEAELANECAATPECEERDAWAVRALKAEAELAALREGATVTYRVDRVMVGGVEQDWTYSTVSGARNYYDDVKSWPDNKIVTLREIITRERILDTTGKEG